jgi:hypothetical protein
VMLIDLLNMLVTKSGDEDSGVKILNLLWAGLGLLVQCANCWELTFFWVSTMCIVSAFPMRS